MHQGFISRFFIHGDIHPPAQITPHLKEGSPYFRRNLAVKS
jgi:hypothetical protein